MVRIGVTSDTHGLVRPEVLAAFAGVDQIFHAGDVGEGDVIAKLETVAPVTAVSGNIDIGQPWARQLNDIEVLTIEDRHILLCHHREKAARWRGLQRCDLVIYGHSHQPHWQQGPGLQWLNPGSAGQRRFKLPVSVALLTVTSAALRVEWINLL